MICELSSVSQVTTTRRLAADKPSIIVGKLRASSLKYISWHYNIIIVHVKSDVQLDYLPEYIKPPHLDHYARSLLHKRANFEISDLTTILLFCVYSIFYPTHASIYMNMLAKCFTLQVSIS